MERLSGIMTVEEIQSIVEHARKNGVKKISIEPSNVTIEFTETKEGADRFESSWGPELFGSKWQVPLVVPEISPEIAKEIEKLREESTIEQLKALDPVRYEAMLADELIEDIHD